MTDIEERLLSLEDSFDTLRRTIEAASLNRSAQTIETANLNHSALCELARQLSRLVDSLYVVANRSKTSDAPSPKRRDSRGFLIGRRKKKVKT
jgi:hypothetical protein